MSATAQVPKLETIEITLFPNGVAEIAHNRPKRYNALSPQSYRVKFILTRTLFDHVLKYHV